MTFFHLWPSRLKSMPMTRHYNSNTRKRRTASPTWRGPCKVIFRIPYSPFEPRHTSVLPAEATAYFRTGFFTTSYFRTVFFVYFRSASKIQVIFSFRYPGRTFLLCLKAVSSSRTAASPRRSTVFQRGWHSAEHALLDRPSGVHAQLDHVRRSEQRNIPRVPRPHTSCQRKLRRFAL